MPGISFYRVNVDIEHLLICIRMWKQWNGTWKWPPARAEIVHDFEIGMAVWEKVSDRCLFNPGRLTSAFERRKSSQLTIFFQALCVVLRCVKRCCVLKDPLMPNCMRTSLRPCNETFSQTSWSLCVYGKKIRLLRPLKQNSLLREADYYGTFLFFGTFLFSWDFFYLQGTFFLFSWDLFIFMRPLYRNKAEYILSRM